MIKKDYSHNKSPSDAPTDEEVKAAIRTIISSIGDDPSRESLLETPNRVLKSYYTIESIHFHLESNCYLKIEMC